MEFSLHLPLFLKMQGNEVEVVKTPTIRSWEVYCSEPTLNNIYDERVFL
jgi:hypothetical protein